MSSRMLRRALWQLWVVIVLLVSFARAQQPARSGEELYVDRLGCWNCHGKTGSGAAGPSISNSQLPLRTFVTSVRLPRGTMPRVAPALASDADLTTLYRWLDGKDAVASPPTIVLSLKPSTEAASDGQTRPDTEVELTAKPDPGLTAETQTSFRYRVTLAQATAPVANRTIQYRPGSSTDSGSAPATRLRVALTPGRYALVVEALEKSAAADQKVVGLGTAILNVP